MGSIQSVCDILALMLTRIITGVSDGARVSATDMTSPTILSAGRLSFQPRLIPDDPAFSLDNIRLIYPKRVPELRGVPHRGATETSHRTG
jgi:hypothetical protein